MKKSQLNLCLAVMLFCTLLSVNVKGASSINILINGKAVEFTDDTGYPYIDENNRTMVPLRVTMEATGSVVGYDSSKSTAIIVTEYGRIEVPVGTDYIYYNNNKNQNDTFSVVSNGRIYLPIRVVLESAHYTVEWDASTHSVNAYNFNYNSNDLVPYNTSSVDTLIKAVLKGNVVYINGRYYATPEYVKMLATPKVHYWDDDLNTAIYPQASRFTEIINSYKEWVTEEDLSQRGIILSTDDPYSKGSGFYAKGSYLSGELLYKMPSIPSDFLYNPYSGAFDCINIKVEDGEILFSQDDLITYGVIDADDPIMERVFVKQ